MKSEILAEAMRILIVAIAVSAGLDILAEAFGRRRAVYFLKPLTTSLIVVLAASVPPPASGYYRAAVVLGLLFSLAGDVFLMLPRDRFVAGLASFLVAHLCYIAAFTSGGGRLSPFAGALLLAWGAVLLARVWTRLGSLRVPVALYASVLLVMAWTAIAARSTAAIGAILFVVSDSALAFERFGRKHRWGQLMVLSTYFAAQLLIAVSVSASPAASTARTQLVMLGTGTPLPDPDRAGPSSAVVIDGTPYLVDAGTGVVRRAAAARNNGIAGLEPRNLRIAFLTHLHSDHTLGLADLILTPWTMGRKEPLELYGPPGTREMVRHLLDAYDVDIRTRTEGLEHSNRTGYHVNVHEISPGVVYKDALVTVTAFNAHHGSIPALGYRFDGPDRAIVIAGDGSGANEAAQNCRGCDVLVEEAYTEASFEMVPAQWQQYRRAFHPSTSEIARNATGARPGLLVLTHRGNAGCDQIGSQACRDAGSEAQLLNEVRAGYKGKVVAAHDLDVF